MRTRELARSLNRTSVSYSEVPLQLRGGTWSHWYIDHRVGLSTMDVLSGAGKLVVRKSMAEGIQYEVVAGAGVGGWALALEVGRQAWLKRKESVPVTLANLDKTDTTLENGYGLHGAHVSGKRVLAVDDIATSGSSAIELIEMLRGDGAVVEDLITVSDRSNGAVAESLARIGVAHHALLQFDESKGRLFPNT